jgi:hypothetical protein
MSDYSKGQIYKLYNEDEPDKCYIGSTIQLLCKRYKNHKKTKNECASKILFENNKKPIIELLEKYPCNNKYELEIRERYWIEQFPNKINLATPGLLEEEIKRNRKDNKQKMKDCLKEYFSTIILKN